MNDCVNSSCMHTRVVFVAEWNGGVGVGGAECFYVKEVFLLEFYRAIIGSKSTASIWLKYFGSQNATPVHYTFIMLREIG